MTRAELAATEWAKRFLETAWLDDYEEALDFAMAPDFAVDISHNNDLGVWKYAVVVRTHKDFWMDSFDTLPHALAFCKRMGWKYD